MRSRLNIILAS